jgi:hypothetical protein
VLAWINLSKGIGCSLLCTVNNWLLLQIGITMKKLSCREYTHLHLFSNWKSSPHVPNIYITCCLASSLFISAIFVFMSCIDFEVVSLIVSRSSKVCWAAASLLSIPRCSKSLMLFWCLCISSICFWYPES